MAQVTYSNLYSESRNNVVTLLTNNVSDPTISSAEFRKWIYSLEPDVKSSDFKGYPLIVVHPADVDFDPDRRTVDMKSQQVNWDIMIDIITSDRGYGKQDGLGLSHMDTITNSVIQVLMDKTNRLSLADNSMKFATPNTTTVMAEEIQNEKVYRRSIVISFRSRIQVSA
jgi:hypothetical protein